MKKKKDVTPPENIPLSSEDIEDLRMFLIIHSRDITPTKDEGSCILGNGISALTIPKRCKHPRRVMVFTQRWTQCEQPVALQALIALAKEHWGPLADTLRYECGNMD
jgi:hypothetical protein